METSTSGNSTIHFCCCSARNQPPSLSILCEKGHLFMSAIFLSTGSSLDPTTQSFILDSIMFLLRWIQSCLSSLQTPIVACLGWILVSILSLQSKKSSMRMKFWGWRRLITLMLPSLTKLMKRIPLTYEYISRILSCP